MGQEKAEGRQNKFEPIKMAFIPGDGRSIQFLSFTTGKTRQLAEIVMPAGNGLTVSPDEKWLLYTQDDQTAADLMLVENFR